MSAVVAEHSAPALEVRDVSHWFGAKLALDKVTFAAPSSRFTVLLGLNGAGKTTLFSLATRLYDSISGQIRVLGHDVRRNPSAALARLGVVFQSRALDVDLTLRQNLMYHAALHGLGRAEARARAAEALDTIGLSDRGDDKVRALSGGQGRRLEIARALLHRPGCLLLDEPTVGLDVESRDGVLRLVRNLVREKGVGALWATHLLDEVEHDDGLIVLHKGRVLHRGSVDELCRRVGASTIKDGFAMLVARPAESE